MNRQFNWVVCAIFAFAILWSWMLSYGCQMCFTKTTARAKECEFAIIDANKLSQTTFVQLMERNDPVLIVNGMRGWPAYKNWNLDKIASRFERRGRRQCTRFRVGKGPYPLEESTIQEWLADNNSRNPIFQYGNPPTSFMINSSATCIPRYSLIYPFSKAMHEKADVTCSLLNDIHIPDFLQPAIISHTGFLLGMSGSGINYHKHADAVNCLVHGQKLWSILVNMETVTRPLKYKVRINVGDALRVARNVKRIPESYLSSIFDRERRGNELRCVQQPGEIVYIPAGLHHAVLNLNYTSAIQLQWNREHWDDNTVRSFLLQVSGSS